MQGAISVLTASYHPPDDPSAVKTPYVIGFRTPKIFAPHSSQQRSELPDISSGGLLNPQGDVDTDMAWRASHERQKTGVPVLKLKWMPPSLPKKTNGESSEGGRKRKSHRGTVSHPYQVCKFLDTLSFHLSSIADISSSQIRCELELLTLSCSDRMVPTSLVSLFKFLKKIYPSDT